MAVYSSNTAPEDKDCWQTPQWLFEALTLEFGFWLDAAANEQNALCPYFLTIEQDALQNDWVSCGAIWCNPLTARLNRGLLKLRSNAQSKTSQ